MLVQAAIGAIRVWWEVLFPALVPFLIIAEVWQALGIVRWLSAMLAPLMRPLFRLPGEAGFVLAVGFASGYPVTARLATQLHTAGALTRAQAERLIGCATTADPMFIATAIAVGLFQRPALAGLLLFAHYVPALAIALAGRWTTRPLPHQPTKPTTFYSNGTPFHQTLLQAIEQALTLVLVIGGYVVGFAVLLAALPLEHIPSPAFAAAVSGVLEVTLGVQALAALSGGIPDTVLLAALSAMLAWGGLSVHLQVAGITAGSGIRYTPFLISRLVHAGLAALCIGLGQMWLH